MINFKFYLASILFKIQFLEDMSHQLMEHGVVGLFILCLLDSAFIPIPSGPDILLVILIVKYNTISSMLTYILGTVMGATLGCTILYMLARRGGEQVLKRVSLERRKQVETLLGRYDMLTLIVISILPPPFPVKPFILCSGVFNFKIERFISSIFIGRTIRATILGLLALYFGSATVDLLKKYGPKILIVILVIAVIALGIRYFSKRGNKLNSQDTQVSEN